MLTSLQIENFRAFKRASVDFSKLNIFVGPNNSGKSSIISAINLISQNISPGVQDTTLALNGPNVQLGTYYDVVHGHSSKSRIGIGFTIDKFRYEYRFRYRPNRREIDLIKFEMTDGERAYRYDKPEETANHEFLTRGSHRYLSSQYLRARFYGFYASLSIPIASRPDSDEEASFHREIREFSFRSMRLVDQHFRSFDSVGAFRAAPERTYYYTGEVPGSVGRFGENFAQMLASHSSSRSRAKANILRQVSNWFVTSGVAQDVTIKPLTNRHFELIIQDNTGSKSNITDSGFGCSQVLPVLVSGYTLLEQKRSLTTPIFVVQEPEIHLHPTAAAHLGTFFVELSRSGLQCFVETHSENIVLRVARHVALKHLSPSDVRIYWVTGNEAEHYLTELSLNPDGTFATDWPEGFFPTRATETMQLARASSGIPSADTFGELFQ